MRILYDSKQLQFKSPFGTLVPGEMCTLHIHVPHTVQAQSVECVLQTENGTVFKTVTMEYAKKIGAYEMFKGRFKRNNLRNKRD